MKYWLCNANIKTYTNALPNRISERKIYPLRKVHGQSQRQAGAVKLFGRRGEEDISDALPDPIKDSLEITDMEKLELK